MSQAPQPTPLMLSVSGCRGVVGASLTPEVVCRFVGAYASRLLASAPRGADGPPTVLLGRDGRAGSDFVHRAALAALAAAGVRAVDLGVAATPSVGFMVRRAGARGGLVLTASHNPAEWNGVKCLDASGAALDAAGMADVISRFHAGRVALAPFDRAGRVDRDETAAHQHVAAVLQAVEPVCPVARIREKRFRVAIDSVNASGRVAGALILDALGCVVTHIGADDTGVFPHPPEPVEANLRSLCDAVRSARAQVGFAQDPDADRLAIVDDRARCIGEEYTLVVGALALLSAPGAPKGAALAANLSTSRMIDDLVIRFGARVHRSAVGEANVVGAMRRHGCVLGGEGNGGVIWPRIVEIRDSVSAMALTLALLTRDGRALSALVTDLPAYTILKRKADIRPGLADAACAAVARRHARERVDESDGVRVDFDSKRAWLHVRASNTEPVLRLIAEAPEARTAEAILDEAQSLLARL